jgi:glycosyltransferase involved in cell wall biosynthesis
MKIGFLTDNYPYAGEAPASPPGGIGTYTQLIGEELAARGHEVHVFAFASVRRHRRLEHKGVVVWQCPAWSKRREMTLAQAAEFTFRHGAEALRLNQYSVAVAVRRAAAGKRFDLVESPDCGAYGALIRSSGVARRYAVRLHTSVEGATGGALTDFQKMERDNAAAADVLTVPTFHARHTIEAAWKESLERAVVVGNPVRRVAAAAPPPAEPPTAVLFGRLGLTKGIDVLARATGLICKQVPAFRAIFIGPNYPWAEGGTTEEAIRRFASETGGGHAVEWRPAVDHGSLMAAVRAHSLVVLPSRAETFGMTFMEALMWSVPCVVSDIGAFRELAQDGEQCLFAKVGYVEDLASKVIQLLMKRELAVRLASAGHQHAERWSVENITDQLLGAWFASPSGRAGMASGNDQAPVLAAGNAC